MNNVTDKINAFFASYTLRKYRKGQVLLLRGEKVDYIYHIVSGAVKQYDVSYRGDEVVLNVFKPPAFFPMSQVMNDTANNYIYEAETDVELHQVPAADAIAFIKDNPDVLYDLLSRVYRGVDGLLGRMAHLMASSAGSRVVYELLVDARRFGKQQPDGSYLIGLSEKDLGSRAGLTRETVSREVGKLKKAGLLAPTAKGLTIISIDGLEKQLGEDL
jgi:CRP-like cAMP-binding protein